MKDVTEPLSVTVYVRPAQLLDPIDAKIDTVQQLESAGKVDSLSIHAWPDKITLSEKTPYAEAIEEFRKMEAWADEQDVSIRPPFDVRTTTSSFTNETTTILRTPIMCLAVYADNRLANVFPHSRSEEQYSVTDAIAALRTGDIDLFSFDADRATQVPERCSECGALLTNVQGLGVCHDCDRIELGGPADEEAARPQLLSQD